VASVEKHMSSTYDTLGIGSRDALVTALAHEPPAPSEATEDLAAQHPSDDVLAPN
jgi:hypothetical protein